MDRRYTILAILAIILAAGLLVIPDKSQTKEMNAETLLLKINDQARFISTDNVTERIIGGDPTLQLIDVRPAGEFKKYALGNAVNIPLDSLLGPAHCELLKQPGKNFVLYSNGDVDADAAWQVCTREGFENVYVMKGGINHWFNTIIKGSEPANTASGEDLELYSFRKSAKMYFTGSTAEINPQVVKPVAAQAKVKVVKKPAEKSSGGGC